ncbi:DUF4352 domain-containing protein [Natronorubrum texcoconense]|uniref:DUF4352 domain-containing protein n=1 Tax=Natronorubrum texcoconense TaxID=1095776 RepID=A0A1G9DAM9_9EURY|nr:DUF4352 domain-containing protein [Natronorubrum texcoconense]SDK60952.1 protein of unknown function [Natronorubrum texcoconense]
MDRIDRRTYLALIGGGAIAIAGCTSDGEDETEAGDDDETRSKTETDGSASSDELGSADESDESDAATPEFGVGDRLEVGDLHVVVADLDLVADVVTGSDREVLEADDGAAFAVVDLALQHVGDEAVVDVDDTVTVTLSDEDGETYDRVDELDAAALDPTERHLAPGEVVRGDLVYDVDDDIEGLVLELESLPSGETATIDLDTKRDAAASESLEHDLTDDALGFSQGVERAGIEVTVASLEHGNNLGGFMQSDEGYEIIAIGVLVENGSGRDRTLSAEQVQLKDEFGRIHGETSGILPALEDFDGTTLNAGEEHESKIAYQVEEGLSELYWVFDFTEWGEDQRVIWQLR